MATEIADTRNDALRADDCSNASFFRSGSRIFVVNGEWWFGTREGDQGPYLSEEIAVIELERYITSCQLLGTKLTYKKQQSARGKPRLVLVESDQKKPKLNTADWRI